MRRISVSDLNASLSSFIINLDIFSQHMLIVIEVLKMCNDKKALFVIKEVVVKLT